MNKIHIGSGGGVTLCFVLLILTGCAATTPNGEPVIDCPNRAADLRGTVKDSGGSFRLHRQALSSYMMGGNRHYKWDVPGKLVWRVSMQFLADAYMVKLNCTKNGVIQRHPPPEPIGLESNVLLMGCPGCKISVVATDPDTGQSVDFSNELFPRGASEAYFFEPHRKPVPGIYNPGVRRIYWNVAYSEGIKSFRQKPEQLKFVFVTQFAREYQSTIDYGWSVNQVIGVTRTPLDIPNNYPEALTVTEEQVLTSSELHLSVLDEYPPWEVAEYGRDVVEDKYKARLAKALKAKDYKAVIEALKKLELTTGPRDEYYYFLGFAYEKLELDNGVAESYYKKYVKAAGRDGKYYSIAIGKF